MYNEPGPDESSRRRSDGPDRRRPPPKSDDRHPHVQSAYHKHPSLGLSGYRNEKRGSVFPRVPIVREAPITMKRQMVSVPRTRGEHDFEREKEIVANRRTERLSSAVVDKETSFAGLAFAGRSSLLRPFGNKKFLYEELQGTKSFRLIKILPKTSSKLKCEMIHSSLLEPPEYVAISYAWGDRFDEKHITMERDDRFPVNVSLHDALVAIRERDCSNLVWIDGLSIDQGNKVERAEQVRLMDQIYRKAKSVAIWLGPETGYSGRAIRLLEGLGDGQRASDWIKSVDHDDRTALRSLFKRAYWKRLWVVQEVYHARTANVYCGPSKLPWDLYSKVSDALWQDQSDPYIRTGPSSFPDVRRLLTLGPDSLLEVLQACRRKLSENPRDKIFGVLGILPNEVRKHLHVTYDKSVKSLYLEVAQLIITSTYRLDVIREAIHFPPQINSADLPTWCPDWAQAPETSALSARDFSASGDSCAVYKFEDKSRKLRISAIKLGVVDRAGVAVGTLCAAQDYLMAFLNWRTLLLSFFNIGEDRETRHPSVHDFCQTLSLGQVLEGWECDWTKACYQVFSSLIQERFPRFKLDRHFEQHKELRILEHGERRSFIQKHFGDQMMGRTFCIMENGLIGMGTGFMRSDDVVVVPLGCSTPILLRVDGQNGGFSYIGDVYIHGYMHGKALESGKPVKEYTLH